MTMQELKFEAPGKGPWETDGTHFPRPVSPITADAFQTSFAKGFAVGTARFGLLLSHFKPAVVNGFFYQQPVAFGAPEGAMGPPPKFIFKLLTRLHPGMRKRIAAGKQAFANKIWREDLKKWDEEHKPASIKRMLALQSVDLASLDTEKLVAHLDECRKLLSDMIYQHHIFTIPCIAPIGEFLVHVSEWTGKTPGEVLLALKGSSPVSVGAAAPQLAALGEAIRGDAATNELVASTKPAGEVLEALRTREDKIGELTREYIQHAGYRSIGYDVGDPFALELPEILVGAIRTAAKGNFSMDTDRGSKARIDALRAAVPSQHHAAFDELLREARTINRLRDERGIYSDTWATGIARRAILAVGDRLKAAGKIDDRELATDATYDELVAMLRGGSGPSSTELAARAKRRKTMTVADIPPFLNAQPAPPPPLDWLPPDAVMPAKIVGMVIGNIFGEPPAQVTESSVKGLPVSPGIYEGTARLVKSTDDFGKLQQGDVLVTRSTSPSFNVVLPLLGAIVTDRGGQLSHAAIVAREYGIPAVVGTTEGTKVLRDGARVRVDGDTGEVKVIG
jgi:pyruvate,water dikinase